MMKDETDDDDEAEAEFDRDSNSKVWRMREQHYVMFMVE
jgi:hypothetical protein